MKFFLSVLVFLVVAAAILADETIGFLLLFALIPSLLTYIALLLKERL